MDLRQGDVGTTVPAGTNEVVMEIDATLENGSSTGTVTVNGQTALDLSVFGTDLNFYPILKHQASGLYHCTMVKDGEVLVDESFLQRGLKWEPSWPVIERSTFEPIRFEHRLVWDTGDPSVEASQPRWRATFPGAALPPFVNGSQPYQSGSNASFTYDPSHLSISSRALNRVLGFKLVPETDGPARTDLLQAREAQTTYPYRVQGDAVSYPNDPGNGSPGDLRISANGDGLVPAKIPQLYVDNARFTPNPSLLGQGSLFSADVITFYYDQPEIRWSYTLDGPDPEDPENSTLTYQTLGTQGEWQDFTQDFLLQAPWDGKAPSGLLGPAGSYYATLTVEVREKTGGFLTYHQEIQVLDVQADPSDDYFKIQLEDEGGQIVGTSEPAELQPVVGEADPLANLPPVEVADARFRGASNNEILVLQRDENGNLLSRELEVKVFVSASLPQPQEITVKLIPSYPDGITVPLNFVGRAAPDPDRIGYTANVMKGKVRVGGSTSQALRQLGLREHAQDSFSSYDQTSDSVYKGQFFDGYENWQDSDAFGNRERAFGNQEHGRATAHDLNKKHSTLGFPVAVPLTYTAFNVAGFETLLAVDPRGRKDAWTRIANQAHTLYLSAHGGHEEGRLSGYSPESANWHDVKIAILAGCSVADIGDYNSDVGGALNEHTFDGFGYGRLWHSRLAPDGVLLGYNSSAPLALIDEPIKIDTRIVNDFYARRASFAGQDSERLAMAWIEANLAHSSTRIEGNSSEMNNACAVTPNYYYFVRVGLNEKRDGVVRKIISKEIFRVHRDFWQPQYYKAEGFEALREKGRVKLMPSSFNLNP